MEIINEVFNQFEELSNATNTLFNLAIAQLSLDIITLCLSGAMFLMMVYICFKSRGD